MWLVTGGDTEVACRRRERLAILSKNALMVEDAKLDGEDMGRRDARSLPFQERSRAMEDERRRMFHMVARWVCFF